MKGGKSEEIPISLEMLSNDNRVGALLGVGLCLFGVGLSDLLGWNQFFQPDGIGAALVRPCLLILGLILIVLSAQRLLIPGCKPLLRINFGGVTDVRLVTAPLRWSTIIDAHRPQGIWQYLLPGVILELNDGCCSTGLETLWSRLIHLPSRLRGKNILFLECGTLDHSSEKVLEAIQSHLRSKSMGSRR